LKTIGTETKVGIFVVLGILVLTYFTVRVGHINVREEGYRVYAYVENASGLDKNSVARIAGVDVGRVEGITLDGVKAKVTLLIPVKVQIPLDSKIYVKSVGLLGEKYVEIVPGSGAQMVKANGTIAEGGPSVDIDRVLSQLSSIGGDVKSVTESLSHALGGEKGERDLKEIVTGARETMTNLQNITQTIQKGEGTIGKLVKDDRLYLEVKNTVSSLNQVAETIGKGEGTLGKLVKDDALYVEAKETIASLNKLAQSIEKGEGTLGKLAKDEALYEKTKEAMEEAKNTFANLNKVAASIEKGEGTLGKLVKDDTLYVQAKETMVEAKETMANLNKVSKQIENGEGTLGKLVKDEALYDDTKKAMKSVQKAADGITEVTPVTVLGILLGTVIR
jgi:phospholipid/cholesterol/gamma-HCH transport system substrate-binding protein